MNQSKLTYLVVEVVVVALFHDIHLVDMVGFVHRQFTCGQCRQHPLERRVTRTATHTHTTNRIALTPQIYYTGNESSTSLLANGGEILFWGGRNFERASKISYNYVNTILGIWELLGRQKG